MHRIAITAVCSLLSLATACASGGGEDAAQEDSASAGQVTESAPAAAQQPSGGEPASAEASMTVADIDRWQRGMEAELAAVRQAGEKFKAAKSATDSMSAMMEANETSTRAAGARAAGVDENRYGTIRSTFSAIVRYMVPLEAEMDVSQMPAEMRAAMQKDREQTVERAAAAFPTEVMEALGPRATELRRQEMALVGERLRAAGMAK
jgi:hypothetical protein